MIATNSLPPQVMEEAVGKETAAQKRERKAFRNRISFHFLDKEYPSTEYFPFTAPQLGKWLWCTTKAMKDAEERKQRKVGEKRPSPEVVDLISVSDIEELIADDDNTQASDAIDQMLEENPEALEDLF